MERDRIDTEGEESDASTDSQNRNHGSRLKTEITGLNRCHVNSDMNISSYMGTGTDSDEESYSVPLINTVNHTDCTQDNSQSMIRWGETRSVTEESRGLSMPQRGNMGENVWSTSNQKPFVHRSDGLPMEPQPLPDYIRTGIESNTNEEAKTNDRRPDLNMRGHAVCTAKVYEDLKRLGYQGGIQDERDPDVIRGKNGENCASGGSNPGPSNCEPQLLPTELHSNHSEEVQGITENQHSDDTGNQSGDTRSTSNVRTHKIGGMRRTVSDSQGENDESSQQTIDSGWSNEEYFAGVCQRTEGAVEHSLIPPFDQISEAAKDLDKYKEVWGEALQKEWENVDREERKLESRMVDLMITTDSQGDPHFQVDDIDCENYESASAGCFIDGVYIRFVSSMVGFRSIVFEVPKGSPLRDGRINLDLTLHPMQIGNDRARKELQRVEWIPEVTAPPDSEANGFKFTAVDKAMEDHIRHIGDLITHEQGVGLLLGPPGTGKTRWSCELAVQMKMLRPKGVTIFTAGCNVALDSFAIRANKHMRVAKFLSESRRQQPGLEEDPLCVHQILLRDRLYKELEEEKQKTRMNRKEVRTATQQILAAIMRKCDVICCTVVMIPPLTKMLEGRRINMIAVDEASQISEGYAPIIYNPLHRQRAGVLVMIGDHYQMRPFAGKHRAVVPQMAVSFYERMMKNNAPHKVLTEHYRSGPSLSWPLQYFYNDTGQDIVSKGPSEAKWGPSFERWVTCPGKLDDDLRIVAKTYQRLSGWLSNGGGGQNIVIMTHFAETVERIRTLLPQAQIKSIASIQGEEQQFTMIYLQNRVLNSLQTCPLSTNVALTRAQVGRIIIGTDTIDTNCAWRDYLAHMYKNGNIVNKREEFDRIELQQLKDVRITARQVGLRVEETTIAKFRRLSDTEQQKVETKEVTEGIVFKMDAKSETATTDQTKTQPKTRDYWEFDGKQDDGEYTIFRRIHVGRRKALFTPTNAGLNASITRRLSSVRTTVVNGQEDAIIDDWRDNNVSHRLLQLEWTGTTTFTRLPTTDTSEDTRTETQASEDKNRDDEGDDKGSTEHKSGEKEASTNPFVDWEYTEQKSGSRFATFSRKRAAPSTGRDSTPGITESGDKTILKSKMPIIIYGSDCRSGKTEGLPHELYITCPEQDITKEARLQELRIPGKVVEQQIKGKAVYVMFARDKPGDAAEGIESSGLRGRWMGLALDEVAKLVALRASKTEPVGIAVIESAEINRKTHRRIMQNLDGKIRMCAAENAIQLPKLQFEYWSNIHDQDRSEHGAVVQPEIQSLTVYSSDSNEEDEPLFTVTDADDQSLAMQRRDVIEILQLPILPMGIRIPVYKWEVEGTTTHILLADREGVRRSADIAGNTLQVLCCDADPREGTMGCIEVQIDTEDAALVEEIVSVVEDIRKKVLELKPKYVMVNCDAARKRAPFMVIAMMVHAGVGRKQAIRIMEQSKPNFLMIFGRTLSMMEQHMHGKSIRDDQIEIEGQRQSKGYDILVASAEKGDETGGSSNTEGEVVTHPAIGSTTIGEVFEARGKYGGKCMTIRKESGKPAEIRPNEKVEEEFMKQAEIHIRQAIGETERPIPDKSQLQKTQAQFLEDAGQQAQDYAKNRQDGLEGRIARYKAIAEKYTVASARKCNDRDDAREYAAIYIDDVNSGFKTLFEGCLQLLQPAATALDLGAAFGLRKSKFMRRELTALGKIYKKGAREICGKVINNILEWEGLPKDAAMVRSLVGLMIYYADLWDWSYRRITHEMRKVARTRTSKEFGLAILQPESLKAFADFRRYLSTGKRHLWNRADISSGERKLFVLIDSCLTGAGYAVISVAKRTLDEWVAGGKSDEEILTTMASEIQVHEIGNTSFPERSKLVLCAWQCECLGTLFFKRKSDPTYKYLPRTVLNDHQNLSAGTEQQLGIATSESMVRRLQELYAWRDSPGLRIGFSSGEASWIPDCLSRNTVESYENESQFEKELRRSYKSLLHSIWKPQREYEIPTEDISRVMEETEITQQDVNKFATIAEEREGAGDDTNAGNASIYATDEEARDDMGAVDAVMQTMLDEDEEDDDVTMEDAHRRGFLENDFITPGKQMKTKWFAADEEVWSRILNEIPEEVSDLPEVVESEEVMTFVDSATNELLNRSLLMTVLPSKVYLMSPSQIQRVTTEVIPKTLRQQGEFTTMVKIQRRRKSILIGDTIISREVVAWTPRKNSTIADGKYIETFLVVERIYDTNEDLSQSGNDGGVMATLPEEVRSKLEELEGRLHPVLAWLKEMKSGRVPMILGELVEGQELSSSRCFPVRRHEAEVNLPVPIVPGAEGDKKKIRPRIKEKASRFHDINEIAELFRGNLIGKRKGIKLDTNDLRALHQKGSCLSKEMIEDLLEKAGYDFEEADIDRAIESCQNCWGNLMKQRRILNSFTAPNPKRWHIDVTFVIADANAIRAPRGLPNWDTLYKYDYSDPPAEGVRNIACEIGTMSCNVAANVTCKQQIFRQWQMVGAPERITVSDSEAIGIALNGLTSCGITLEPCPRKTPNSQSLLCLRQVVFKVDFYTTDNTMSFDERVALAEAKTNERTQAGIHCRLLLPGSSCICMRALAAKGIITESACRTITSQRVQRCLKQKLYSMTTLKQPDFTKNPNPRVVFWSSKYHYGWGTYIGQVAGIAAVSALGEFLRVSVYHIAWAKCDTDETADPFDKYLSVLSPNKAGASAATKGTWKVYVINDTAELDDHDKIQEKPCLALVRVCAIGGESIAQMRPPGAKAHVRDTIGRIKVNAVKAPMLQLTYEDGTAYYGREWITESQGKQQRAVYWETASTNVVVQRYAWISVTQDSTGFPTEIDTSAIGMKRRKMGNESEQGEVSSTFSASIRGAESDDTEIPIGIGIVEEIGRWLKFAEILGRAHTRIKAIEVIGCWERFVVVKPNGEKAMAISHGDVDNWDLEEENQPGFYETGEVVDDAILRIESRVKAGRAVTLVAEYARHIREGIGLSYGKSFEVLEKVNGRHVTPHYYGKQVALLKTQEPKAGGWINMANCDIGGVESGGEIFRKHEYFGKGRGTKPKLAWMAIAIRPKAMNDETSEHFGAMVDTCCLGGPGGLVAEGMETVPGLAELIKDGHSNYKHWVHSICTTKLWRELKRIGYQETIVMKKSHGIAGVNGFTVDNKPCIKDVRFEIMSVDGRIYEIDHKFKLYHFARWRGAGNIDIGLGACDLHQLGLSLDPIKKGTITFTRLPVQGDTIELSVSKTLCINHNQQGSVDAIMKEDNHGSEIEEEEETFIVNATKRARVQTAAENQEHIIELMVPLPVGELVMVSISKKDRCRVLLSKGEDRELNIFQVPTDKIIRLRITPLPGRSIPASGVNVEVRPLETTAGRRPIEMKAVSKLCAKAQEDPVMKEIHESDRELQSITHEPHITLGGRQHEIIRKKRKLFAYCGTDSEGTNWHTSHTATGAVTIGIREAETVVYGDAERFLKNLGLEHDSHSLIVNAEMNDPRIQTRMILCNQRGAEELRRTWNRDGGADDKIIDVVCNPKDYGSGTAGSDDEPKGDPNVEQVDIEFGGVRAELEDRIRDGIDAIVKHYSGDTAIILVSCRYAVHRSVMVMRALMAELYGIPPSESKRIIQEVRPAAAWILESVVEEYQKGSKVSATYLGRVSAAKYKTKIGTDATVFDLASSFREDDSYYGSVPERDSIVHKYNIIRRHLDVDRSLVYELARDEGISRAEAQQVIEVVVDLLAELYCQSFFSEGQKIPTLNIPEVGTEYLDFSRANPSRKLRLLRLGPIEQKLNDLLINRDVWNEVVGDYQIGDLPALLVSPAFRAPRAGTILGRLVVDYRPLNTLIIDVNTVEERNVDNVIDGRTRGFAEADLSRAFPSIPISPAFARYAALSVGNRLLKAQKPYLGIKHLPGVFTQSIYPAFMRLGLTEKTVENFKKDILQLIRDGIRPPIRMEAIED